MLTESFIKRIKPQASAKKYADGHGLYLFVSKTGSKSWRMNYQFAGKSKTLSFGRYPELSPDSARDIRDAVKVFLSDGIDPATKIDVLRADLRTETFEDVAREWLARHGEALSMRRRTYLRRCLERYFFPAFGSVSIKDVESQHILRLLREVEDKGTISVAHELLQLAGRIFRYAVSTSRIAFDTTASLKGSLRIRKPRHRNAIFDKMEIGKMLDLFERQPYDNAINYALCILPHVFLRGRELVEAQWSEIDFEHDEWRIPGLRMKERETHIVPLSRQVKKLLTELREMTGSSQWLFPSPVCKDKPVTLRGVLARLRRLGFSEEEICLHGFRAIASTYLNELGYNVDWIERQLSHAPRDKVRASYNYAQYLAGRREMMQKWSDWLDQQKERV